MSRNEPPPNLLLILCDQMRADALGIEGHLEAFTPHLDGLAAAGSRFTHAYSPCPSCIPARAGLWTGLDPWRCGILGMGVRQPRIHGQFSPTLAGRFVEAGYRVHGVGKAHFTPPRLLMGFESFELDEAGRMERNGEQDEYSAWFARHAPAGTDPRDHGISPNSWVARPWPHAEHLHPSAWTATRAIEFLRQRDRGRPFFLHVSFDRPHSPYTPPRHFFEAHLDGRRASRPSVGAWAEENARLGDPRDPDAWRAELPEASAREARAGYLGEVAFLDQQVGRVLDHFRRVERGTLDNTWIVFLSDHGDMLGDHHLWRKCQPYEGSARIPLIVVPPKTRRREFPKREVGDVAQIADLMPTLLEAAGLPAAEGISGRSLLAPMRDDAAGWRTFLHGEHCVQYSPEQENQFVTDGRRKFIWFPRTGREQYFNLEADPCECRDLSREPAVAAERDLWRERLAGALRERRCGWCEEGVLSATEGEMVSPHAS